MKVQNTSSHKASSFKYIVNFLASKYRHSEKVKLVVSDTKPGMLCGGAASTHPDVAPTPQVVLSLSDKSTAYPIEVGYPIQQVRDAAGSMVVETWEEEVVLTLAHELQHIQDLLDGARVTTEADLVAFEIKAEKSAFAALRAWRNERKDWLPVRTRPRQTTSARL